MKIQSLKLVYFSPTGTTKRIIEGIARGISQSAVGIVDITKPEARKQQLQTSEDELLVVGVPVYYGRVPAAAIDWLHTIKARNTPTVCVVVYGNRDYDDALLELKDTVVKHGCMPITCAAYIGEHSFSNSEMELSKRDRVTGRIVSLFLRNTFGKLTAWSNFVIKRGSLISFMELASMSK